MHGLIEELPALLSGLGLRFLPNAVDCEVQVLRGRDLVCTLDLDDEIEVWTAGVPCGVAGRVVYADPDFLVKTAAIIQRVAERADYLANRPNRGWVP